MKRCHYEYEGKTGIAVSNDFAKKGIASLVVNIGNVCEFGCLYCYVLSVVNKQVSVYSRLQNGECIKDFSQYRSRANVLECITNDVKKYRYTKGVVLFCSTCDPCATKEHLTTTELAIKIILENTEYLQVRVLSKSALITKLADNLSAFKDRIIYGCSTGILDSKVAGTIEIGASAIEARIGAIHYLQDNGYRTFSMVCPVPPSMADKTSIQNLLREIRFQRSEHLWCEPFNVRGSALNLTYEALMKCGLDHHAQMLKEVKESRGKWIEYSKALFMDLKTTIHSIKRGHPFTYLQYVNDRERQLYEEQDGLALL